MFSQLSFNLLCFNIILCTSYNYTYFLIKYGYFKNDLSDTMEMSAPSEAILSFQNTFHLNETGVFDESTIALMDKPRCEKPDNELLDFSLKPGSKWKKLDIRWNMVNGSYYQKLQIHRAFKIWEEDSILKFYFSNIKPDIVVSLRTRNHTGVKGCMNTCTFAFDGPGASLAHAYFPTPDQRCKELHIDAEENFFYGKLEDTPKHQTNFLNVVLHEIGHTLGIAHSNQIADVMYPWYGVGLNELGIGDKLALEALYGSKRSNTTSSTTPQVTYS